MVAFITLANNFNPTLLGNDDSALNDMQYRASWGLLVASGFFYTIGSLAFVRAMSDPPMKPMFSNYHFQTDELFGSWMFAFATFPAVPYSLIFLSVFKETIFLAMLAVSIAGVLGTLLFVYACYPKKGGEDDESHVSGRTGVHIFFRCPQNILIL